ncbi:MAG: PQQ-binding-like beta-propeller repeat protein [Verrucomicrobiota bacterium]|nr:PQQ-binding-like beta-propeller repeat protein [Verrucomicrobiota bacterium]
MAPAETERFAAPPRFTNFALPLAVIVGALVAAAFFRPWFPQAHGRIESLARYAPLAEGGARLTRESDATGTPTAWTSQNDILLPPLLAIAAEMRKEERDAINKFFRRPGESEELESKVLVARMNGAQIYQSRSRRLGVDGKTSDSLLLAIRNDEADYLIAIYEPAADAETIFDPPIPLLETDLTPGRSWSAKGKRLSKQGTLDYEYSARVAEKKNYKNDLGEFADTLKIETRITFKSGEQVGYDGLDNYWLAPGLGAVDAQTFDPAGKLQSRTVMLSSTDRQMQIAKLPAIPKPAETQPPATDAASWEMSRFASTRSASDNSESSVPPTFIPTDPPLLLAARYGSGMTAFNASEPGAPALWKFQTGGTIYGSPAFDAERGRIYFGAADKRLYALDTRGLFLWSFLTRDNVATRPLVLEDSVIFGSEDRSVYCVRADSGAEVWRTKFGAAVVSAPVAVGELAIFGSDDGRVHALDVHTGKERWFAKVEGAVEAPVVAAGDRVFAVTHSGYLIALNAEDGEDVWSASIGGEPRTAPAVTRDAVYVVNGYGSLGAYDLRNGQRLWFSAEMELVGPPLVVGERLIIGRENGDACAFDFAGHEVKTWEAASVSNVADGLASLTLGGTIGGDAVWFADSKSVIRRLGPRMIGAATLRPAWLLPFSQEPLTKHFMTVSPLAYKDRVLAIDGERDLFLLDPHNGKGKRLGTFGETAAATMEPIIAGDTLLATSGKTLYAVDLLGGTTRWKFEAQESSAQPATVAGNTVLWLTQHFPTGADGKTASPIGTLHALDLQTGAVRWERPLAGFTGVGAALIAGGTIYTSAPAAAFDLASGEMRWQASLPDNPLGGGVLSENADTLFVGLVSNQNSLASIAALRTSDGGVAWQQKIGPSPLHPFERISRDREVLVVPLWSGEIVGLSSVNGAELWRHKPARPRYGAISVANGQVWFAENNSQVIALDAQTGRALARLSLDIDIAAIQAFSPRPLIMGKNVIVPLGAALLGIRIPAEVAAPAPEGGLKE